MKTTEPTGVIYSGSLDAVDSLIKTERVSHLVSLLAPDSMIETPQGILPQHHLQLGMTDTGGLESLKDGPSEAHVAKLLSFVESWNQKAPLLIHCLAGVSRSTAAVFITLCTLNEKTEEKTIARLLRQRAPHAYPNKWLVGLGDKALKREGRMAQAIEAMPPPKISSWRASEASYPAAITRPKD